MSEHKRTIVHHHKLETSTKLILAAIAVALALQVFGPSLSIREVFAELSGGETYSPFTVNITHSGRIGD